MMSSIIENAQRKRDMIVLDMILTCGVDPIKNVINVLNANKKMTSIGKWNIVFKCLEKEYSHVYTRDGFHTLITELVEQYDYGHLQTTADLIDKYWTYKTKEEPKQVIEEVIETPVFRDPRK